MADVQQDAPITEGLEVVPAEGGEPGSPAEAASPAGAGTAESLDEVRLQRDEYYDLLLRKSAEFDNYRKRVDRERREMADLAAADVVKELLPLIDTLDRAAKAPAHEASLEAFRRGIELIQRQLEDVLAKRGVQVIDPLGADFDPRLHEAVMRAGAEGRRDGEVIEVFSRGYKLGDRLLRPAMVKVATA
jgi:molecular chaperone GrpE